MERHLMTPRETSETSEGSPPGPTLLSHLSHPANPKAQMTTYAAEVEARRAQLLALANAATGEGLRLLDIADALRRHAGRLETFPPTPATGQPTVPNLSNQPTKSETP